MRREVRVDNRFFDDVDAAFWPERGPNGEPSADDFIRLDLFGIKRRSPSGSMTSRSSQQLREFEC